MYTACSLILCLAVFAAPALASCGTCGTCAVSALPGPTFCAQTPVVQNPTRLIPGNIPHGAVTTAQHCFRTVTRPQLRNEVITVPSVDRIVRYVPGPVEAVTVNCGSASRGGALPTVACGAAPALAGGLVGTGYGYGGLAGAGYGYGGLAGAGYGCGGLVGAGCGGLVGAGYGCGGLVGAGYGCGGLVGAGCGGLVGAGCGGCVV